MGAPHTRGNPGTRCLQQGDVLAYSLTLERCFIVLLIQVAEKLTVLQGALAKVKSDAALELMNKLARNAAQNPAEEKYRKVSRQNTRMHGV